MGRALDPRMKGHGIRSPTESNQTFASHFIIVATMPGARHDQNVAREDWLALCQDMTGWMGYCFTGVSSIVANYCQVMSILQAVKSR